MPAEKKEDLPHPRLNEPSNDQGALILAIWVSFSSPRTDIPNNSYLLCHDASGKIACNELTLVASEIGDMISPRNLGKKLISESNPRALYGISYLLSLQEYIGAACLLTGR